MKKRLHLGCGNKYLKDWIHIDIQAYDHVDLNIPVDQLTCFDDESVDEVYACHILEHIKRKDIKKVLIEWHRVLKRDGVLRLSVPDWDALVNRYQKTRNLDELMGLLYGGQRNEYDFHYMTFNFDSLTKLLREIGFNKIEKYDPLTFIPEKYDDYSRAYLPHMDFKHGDLMSLNIVASRIL